MAIFVVLTEVLYLVQLYIAAKKFNVTLNLTNTDNTLIQLIAFTMKLMYKLYNIV